MERYIVEGAQCRCGVPDIRAIRKALGLTQKRMAEALCLSLSGYRYLERARPHTCPRLAVRAYLWDLLSFPEVQRILLGAGIVIRREPESPPFSGPKASSAA